MGKASMVSIVTEAPMMPVDAASTVPMIVTPSARPPGTRRISVCKPSSSSSATPLLSSNVPMRTNIGTATMTTLETTPPKMRLTSSGN